MRNIFLKAHEMTREMKREYPEVNYRAQFGLNLSYLLSNKEERQMIKFTKGNTEFVLTNLDYNGDNLVCDVTINDDITTKGSFMIFPQGQGFLFNPAVEIDGKPSNGVALPEEISYKELRKIARNSGKELNKNAVLTFELDPVRFDNHENTKTVKQFKNELTPKIAHRVGVELKRQGYIVHQSHTSFGYRHIFECTVEKLEESIETAKNYKEKSMNWMNNYDVAE